MSFHFNDPVSIILDLEVETPTFVDSGLPDIFFFIELLGVQ